MKKYLILTSISEPTIATIKYAEITDKKTIVKFFDQSV